MQKRSQELKRNQDSEYLSSDAEGRTESPAPKKRIRLSGYNTSDDEEASHIGLDEGKSRKLSLNQLRGGLRKENASTSPDPAYISKESSRRPDETKNSSFVNARCETVNVTTAAVAAMSPSIHEDGLDKRSAFREVGRSRHAGGVASRHGQSCQEHPRYQTNSNKYNQVRPCETMFPDYSYLSNSIVPVAVPRGAAVTSYPSLRDAARWQHAATGVAGVAAAHYASYYQNFLPKTRVELKTETERYMERLLARERAQADSFALRCAMDKSALPVSPNFARRMPDPLSSPPGMVTFPRSEGAVDPNHVFAWQRQLISSAVFPLSSSMVDLPSENWCAKCNASFRMTSDLVYHMRTHHKRNELEDPESKRRDDKLKCSVCNETFRERHHLTRHMTSHVNG